MESSSSTPSASSHASSIVRAALRTPIPSPATPSPARCAGAYEITSPNSAWDEAITSPAPPPKYHLYGLANSESSVADDQAEPTTKHAEPTALPTVPVQNTEDLVSAIQCPYHTVYAYGTSGLVWAHSAPSHSPGTMPQTPARRCSPYHACQACSNDGVGSGDSPGHLMEGRRLKSDIGYE
jgi:hypothetical protein